MPLTRLGDRRINALAIGDRRVRKRYRGDDLIWSPFAGSAAVDAFFGAPQLTVPNRAIAQLTVAGTPWPEYVRFTSDRGRDQSAYLRGLLAGQTSGRAVVTVQILGVGQASGTETWSALFANGVTEHTATLPVTWP